MRTLNLLKFVNYIWEQNSNAKRLATQFSVALGGGGGGADETHAPTELVRITTL
jgi:hypothetical protein